MKKFLFCAAAAVILVANESGAQSPEKVMEKAFLAIKNCEVDEMIKYNHFELDAAEKAVRINKVKSDCADEAYRKKMNSRELLAAPKIIEQSDKKAIVEITWKEDGEPEVTERETLVKMGGKWLVLVK